MSALEIYTSKGKVDIGHIVYVDQLHMPLTSLKLLTFLSY